MSQKKHLAFWHLAFSFTITELKLMDFGTFFELECNHRKCNLHESFKDRIHSWLCFGKWYEKLLHGAFCKFHRPTQFASLILPTIGSRLRAARIQIPSSNRLVCLKYMFRLRYPNANKRSSFEIMPFSFTI